MRDQTDRATDTLTIHLIYTGGTFGCVGQPLTPLSTATFVPILRQQLSALYRADWQITCLEPPLDSSQITPQHWLSILRMCLVCYQQCRAPMILIHGTDTLAYTAAFLAEALAGSDLHVCVTGSQRPLLPPQFTAQSRVDSHPTDPQTDAIDNLRSALQAVLQAPAGVSVAFAGEYWPAQTCQKIHSQDLAAFTGHHRAAYPANSYQPLHPQQQQRWLDQAFAQLERLAQTLCEIRVSVYYAAPQPLAQTLEQLSDLLARQPDGLILMSYGSGNLPQSPQLQRLLDQAIQQGCLVVVATQVPFGGTDTRYATGNWLAELGALPSARLTLPAIYARLSWICAIEGEPVRRRKRWMQCLSDTRLAKR